MLIVSIVMATQRTLSEWVEYIQTLHHRQIDLSLDRVASVLQRIAPAVLPFKVVAIAGTNGKGSTAEILASIYRAGGYRVGKYTSPHLVIFNERINIDGCSVSDAGLLASFERIESKRAGVPITFFEFTTLVALDLFLHADLDIVVLEVGLGGRMDAVNIIDSDVAVITNVSLDHMAWLGDTVDQISIEKSGIARANKPCLVGMSSPPSSLIGACQDAAAELEIIGREFHYVDCRDEWAFVSDTEKMSGLPLPFGQNGVQLNNAALAVRVSQKLRSNLPLTHESIRLGISTAQLLGRCQVLQYDPLIILDVAHNEASLARLATFVRNHSVKRNTIAVCGLLKDKAIVNSLRHIEPFINHWHLASIDDERGSSADDLSLILQQELGVARQSLDCHGDANAAYAQALQTLTAGDCVVVFGSFFIVGDILATLNNE